MVACIGWFVTLHHDERPYEMRVIERDHEAVPSGYRAPPAAVIVSFTVDDVDACAARLADGGHAGGRPGAGRADVVQVTTPSPEWLAANGLAPAAER
jgi:hypothetical protein